MAKKSKFGSAVIFDLIVLVLAGGIFGLLALPFVKAETTIIGFTGSTTVSGYDLLNFEANAGIATVILLIIQVVVGAAFYIGLSVFFKIDTFYYILGIIKTLIKGK